LYRESTGLPIDPAQFAWYAAIRGEGVKRVADGEKLVVVSVKVPPPLKARLLAVCAAHPTAGGTPSDAADLLRTAIERVVSEAEQKSPAPRESTGAGKRKA